MTSELVLINFLKRPLLVSEAAHSAASRHSPPSIPVNVQEEFALVQLLWLLIPSKADFIPDHQLDIVISGIPQRGQRTYHMSLHVPSPSEH